MSISTGAVVALKQIAVAKSRLGDIAPPIRRRLAWAMALDTLRSLAAVVDQLVVVTNQPAAQDGLRRGGVEAEVVPETGTIGLNPALVLGEKTLRAQGIGLVLACVGDLPSLTETSLRLVLGAAADHDRSFLADAAGIGTTMLAATSVPLDPRFQGRSAAAHHSSGAIPLTDGELGGTVSDARRDVDTEIDLYDAYHLGVGPATRSLINPQTRGLAGYSPITIAGRIGGGPVWEVIAASGRRITMAAEAVQDQLRDLHPGQRLHAAVSSDHVLAAWL